VSSIHHTRPRERSLATDAADRGFTVTPEVRGLGLPGVMFRAGDRIVASSVIDATHSGTPFIAGSLLGQYATDSSIPRTVAASWVAIPLKVNVPHILLAGSGIGMLALAGVAFDENQRLRLEGAFDRTFSLYCPTGYERDALQIFTPDLMQLLLDTTAGCDVELVDNWMFVYSWPGRYRDGAALDSLVAVTERVQAKLHRQTGRYRDERSPVASGTISPADHEARVGRVTAHGSRLRTRPTPLQRAVTVGSTLLLVGAAIGVIQFLINR
jgi:hypothetical protein